MAAEPHAKRRRRRRHSFLRGAGSRRDLRTQRRPSEESSFCPSCGGEVELRSRSRLGVDYAVRDWACPAPCGASGTTLPDGELVVLSAPSLPKNQQRFTVGGVLR